MDLSNVTGLVEKGGIFYSRAQSAISYPEDGNDNFYQIEEKSFWFKHRNDCITAAVKKFAPDDVFFDVGGGNGFVAKGLEEAGISTVLVEPGVRGCLNAKKRGLPNVVCATLDDASFAPDSLPSVGLFDVVEHIEADSQFLRSVHRYLRHGGHVFATVPAYQWLWSNEDVDAGHYRRYTLSGMAQKMRAAGFAIEYATYLFSALPLPIFMARTLPSKFGRRENRGAFAKHENEHTDSKGLVGQITSKLWQAELAAVANGRSIPFGSSCFMVAKKGGS